MGLFGDLVQQAMGGFPTKPNVPGAPNVNAQQSQTQATAGNQAALPGLEDLAGATNQFNVGQRRSMLESAIPGYGNLTGEGSDVLSNWLSGNLSPDVASQIRRNTNARAFAGGYGGSGMGDNLTARDLGLTSLDLQKTGLQQLNPFLATTGQLGMPQQMLPQSQFVTTPEQIALNQWNEQNRYSRDWLQNQLDSLPDPATAAIAKDVGGMADTVGSMIPYFGTFYSMSQGGAGGGTGGGFGDMGLTGKNGGGWLSSLFGGGGAGSSVDPALAGIAIA